MVEQYGVEQRSSHPCDPYGVGDVHPSKKRKGVGQEFSETRPPRMDEVLTDGTRPPAREPGSGKTPLRPRMRHVHPLHWNERKLSLPS